MRAPVEVRNEIAIPATAERVWDLLAEVGEWPSWYRACQWVRVESKDDAGRPLSFRWKAHPITLVSRIVASVRPHVFTIVADARGLHADRTFTIRPAPDGLATVVVSDETQIGPLPWVARMYLTPRLHAANEVMFQDLARAAAK